MRGLFVLALCCAVLGLVACSGGTGEDTGENQAAENAEGMQAASGQAEATGDEAMHAANETGDTIKEEAGQMKNAATDAVEETKEDAKEKAEMNPILERSMKKDPGPEDEYAVMHTNMGDIVLRFFPKQAPITVANFKGLAAKGYYDGVTFHRVIDGFMIQGGDPTGSGRGGESLWGPPIVDEFSPQLTFARPGILAMANKGRPKTGSSQFFITLVPTPHLNNKHTIFGEVVEGMDVVNKIGKVQTGANDKPVEPVVIESISFETR